MSGRFISFVENLSRVCGLLAALLLVFSMLVVCEMIFLRYIFRAATIWQTEAVVFSATAAIFLGAPRSEEHTSELQSLMRSSYAVFCLKKKKLGNQSDAFSPTHPHHPNTTD